MDFCNYINLKKPSFWYEHFCFIDVKDYLADALFAKYKVHVRFGAEYNKEGSDYAFIFCKVPKKEADKFREALEELKWKMMLLGHPDYPEICDMFFKLQV